MSGVVPKAYFEHMGYDCELYYKDGVYFGGIYLPETHPSYCEGSLWKEIHGRADSIEEAKKEVAHLAEQLHKMS